MVIPQNVSVNILIAMAVTMGKCSVFEVALSFCLLKISVKNVLVKKRHEQKYLVENVTTCIFNHLINTDKKYY